MNVNEVTGSHSTTEVSALIPRHGHSHAQYDKEPPRYHSHSDTSTTQEFVFEEKNGRELSTGALVLLIYFITCSPFGIEVGVAAGGPLVFSIGLLLLTMVWAFPQAMVSAELSLCFPENGGSVVWVNTAFAGADAGWLGRFVAYMNTSNLLANCVSNYAVLIVLFVDYIARVASVSISTQWLIRLGVVCVVGFINIAGASWVARLNMPLMGLVLVPFLAMFVLEASDGQLAAAATWRHFLVFPEINWSVLISTLCWSFGGFDTVGSLAGEVSGGRSTYIRALIISFPLCLLSFLVPILVGFVAQSDLQMWNSGGFAEIAASQAQWLGVMMVVAACLSNWGQYTSSITAFSRLIWASALHSDAQVLPSIMAFSHVSHKKIIRPVVSICAASVACLAMSALPFDIVVQLFLIQRSINLWCTYAAFVRLKYAPFDTLKRPFVAPGGTLMAWLYGVPTVVLTVTCLVFMRDTRVWIVGASIEVLLVLLYFVRMFVMSKRNPNIAAGSFPHYHDQAHSH